MNSALDRVSKKYAQAFINLKGDVFDRDLIMTVDKLRDYLAAHRELLFYVQIALLDNGQTRQKLYELLSYAGLEVVRPLVALLIEHKRINLLPRVLQWISRLALQRNNFMKFTFESAIKLNSDELNYLREFLAKETGKQIIDRLVINKDLIAGLKVYSETVGFEKSIRKQLRALKSMA